MSIFLIDKIKPINSGKFPVYEDVDGYGGFQVRTNSVDRNGIPAANRKIGMLVYTVAEETFWQLKGGIANINWQQVALGAGGGGSGSGSTITPGPANTVAISDGSSVVFSKITDGYVDGNAAIAGTKINPDFGSQNITTLGSLTANDGYFEAFAKFGGHSKPLSASVGLGNGAIYFDSSDGRFKVSEDGGANYVDLLGSTLPPTHVNQDEVLITYGLGVSGGAPVPLFGKIGNSHVSDNANIDGTKIISDFGQQNILADGYVSVNDGYFDGSVYFQESTQPPVVPSNNGSIYFNSTDHKFKVYENSTDNWVDLVKATVYADDHTPGLVQLSGDLDGYESSYFSPRVGSINGISVPQRSGPANPLKPGNLLQANGDYSLDYGPLNLEGGDGYISGRLPIENGGAALNYCEFSFSSSVIRTSESVWETAGAAIVNSNNIAPQNSGTKTRTIKLRVLLQTTGPEAQVMLYNYDQGSVVALKNTTNQDPTQRQTYLSTTSLTPVLLESDDLTGLLSDSIYEVRIRMVDSLTNTDADQVVCIMSKLCVEWS